MANSPDNTLAQLLNKPLPPIPADIREAINMAEITLTDFEDKNEILTNPQLQLEVGYRADGKGNFLVSMTCPMPGITTDMIEWWFWWHVQDELRYRIWFPGAHFGTSYRKSQRDYFEQPSRPPFSDNTQYPIESVGTMKSALQIDFVTPEEFGFSREAMEAGGIPLIVCGHVGMKHLFKHTEMAHIFRQAPNGLQMFSRFWMGNPLRMKWLKRRFITAETARSMAEHCCVEYRNLASILPGLYREYAGNNQTPAGNQLETVIEAMMKWGQQHRSCMVGG